MKMKRLTKKPMMLLMLIAIFSMALSGSTFASSNADKDQGMSSILRLKEKGIVNGDGSNKFNSKGSLNAATAVTLIVRGLNLNIDNIRFIKEPKASDYYTKVKDNTWYAGNFIIAQFNGLDLPKDINPAAKVTREQFAKWLFGALNTKGEYEWIDIYTELADADQVTKGYMDSIQKLLIAKIATLDSKQKFYPKRNITLGEAAVMIEKTIDFVEKMKPLPNPENPIITDVKLSSDRVSDEVNRITVTAMAPHPGYGFEVSSIVFAKGEAIVNYRVIEPDPNKLYAQVITEVKFVTYISSQYKPVLGSSETVPFNPDQSVSSSQQAS
jgi:hypothetical protein